MVRKISFYEVTPEEKTYIANFHHSTTSIQQKPTYPHWKKGEFGLLPVAPELYKGCDYGNFMNRKRFKIDANGGIVRCAIFEKPCSIKKREKTIFKGYIVIKNISTKDFFVDKYTELGLLIFGYCGFTHLSPTFALYV
jgi:hypothetical protein